MSVAARSSEVARSRRGPDRTLGPEIHPRRAAARVGHLGAASSSVLDPEVLGALAADVGASRFVLGLPTRDGVVVTAPWEDLVVARRRTVELYDAAEPSMRLQRGVLLIEDGRIVDAVSPAPVDPSARPSLAAVALGLGLWIEIVAALWMCVPIR